MVRVVKPNSIIAATVWGERKNCDWADIFPIVDRQVASEACPFFFGLGAPGALRYQFEEAGLGKFEEVRQSETLVISNQQDLLRAMIDGGAVALAARRFSADARTNIESQYLSSVIQSKEEHGGYAIPGIREHQRYLAQLGRRATSKRSSPASLIGPAVQS
jgi:hypothetical protein